MHNLKGLIFLARSRVISLSAYSYEQALPEHLELACAIQSRDSEVAAQIFPVHLNHVFEHAEIYWNGKP